MITLLRDAEVFAPEPLGRCSILVGSGRILWMGREVPAIDSQLLLEEIDLKGARVIPGLVDGHAHTTGGGGEGGASTRVPAPGLSDFTQSGVTSVVGLLGTDSETRGMEELLAHTRALREQGMSAWCYTGGYHIPPKTLTGSVRGDIVHLDPVVGVGELALSDFRSSQPTLDEFLRIASEAQVGGMLSGKAGIVHLHLGDGERGLEMIRAGLQKSELPASLFQPTHVNRKPALFEEALELVSKGCSIDVTCFPEDDGDAAISALEAIKYYLDADLPIDRISASSDSGGCLPNFDDHGHLASMDVGRAQTMAETLASLFESDQAPERFLPAFTSNPANLLKLAGKGELSAGYHADLVVLDSTGYASSVMLRGAWHIYEGEIVRRGTFED